MWGSRVGSSLRVNFNGARIGITLCLSTGLTFLLVLPLSRQVQLNAKWRLVRTCTTILLAQPRCYSRPFAAARTASRRRFVCVATAASGSTTSRRCGAPFGVRLTADLRSFVNCCLGRTPLLSRPPPAALRPSHALPHISQPGSAATTRSFSLLEVATHRLQAIRKASPTRTRHEIRPLSQIGLVPVPCRCPGRRDC
jgi:hypothetical protein